MESSVSDAESTNNGTLGVLNDDVLEELLRYVSTRELISVWRLVSSKWSHFASELCRQRSVSLRMPRGHDHEIVSSRIGHLFSEVDNLPFSAAILTLDSMEPEGHALSNHVTKRFGEHLKSARISTRLNFYDSFFDTLCLTPNLVALEIRPKFEWHESTGQDFTFHHQKIALPKLKSLKMVFEAKGHFMSILEMCFQYFAPQLESIDLRLNTGAIIDGAPFTRCAQLLSGHDFPKTSLGLPFGHEYSDGWRLLVAKGPFDIQKLSVSFCNVSSDDVDEAELLVMNCDLLVLFLANCSGLTSLTLDGFEKRSLTSKQWRVPVMPALKKLKLRLESYGEDDDRTISRFQFEPFTAQRFPGLREVVHCFEFFPTREIDVRQIFDVSEERFHGVTSLDVGSTRSTTNWADVFPNVEKLGAAPLNADVLATIFTDMAQVTAVDLEICNGMLLGLPQHLRSLEKLKTLTLRLNVLGDEIEMFAELSPLNLKMVYSKYELSDYCLSLLRNRHLSVELLMKEND